jgi:hypothetical protein
LIRPDHRSRPAGRHPYREDRQQHHQ